MGVLENKLEKYDIYLKIKLNNKSKYERTLLLQIGKPLSRGCNEEL
jgi:hypothetical protein